MGKNIFAVNGERFGVVNLFGIGDLIAIEPWVDVITNEVFDVAKLRMSLEKRGYVKPDVVKESYTGLWSRFKDDVSYQKGVELLSVALNTAMTRNITYLTIDNMIPAQIDVGGFIETVFLLTNGRVLFEETEVKSFFSYGDEMTIASKNFLLSLSNDALAKETKRASNVLDKVLHYCLDFEQAWRDFEEAVEERHTGSDIDDGNSLKDESSDTKADDNADLMAAKLEFANTPLEDARKHGQPELAEVIENIIRNEKVPNASDETLTIEDLAEACLKTMAHMTESSEAEDKQLDCNCKKESCTCGHSRKCNSADEINERYKTFRGYQEDEVILTPEEIEMLIWAAMML